MKAYLYIPTIFCHAQINITHYTHMCAYTHTHTHPHSWQKQQNEEEMEKEGRETARKEKRHLFMPFKKG